MINAIRSARNYPVRPSFSSSPIPAPVFSKRTWSSFRFKGLASLSSQQESALVMDEAENPETGDAMYHSFGHEYGTRCEDEGFGVVHSTKQSSQQESAHVVDKAENPETGDLMYHSFGHGYGTRCEDEGFGVVHSTKQSETDDTHESQPGSDVEKKKETPAKEGEVQHRTDK